MNIPQADTTQSLLNALPNTNAPIYARLKSAILENIQSSNWMPEQRLPSEAQMVNALGVSRMTVNRALRELATDGVLIRQQGVGTFVAPQKAHSALFEVHNIAQEIADRGHKHETIVVEFVIQQLLFHSCDLGQQFRHHYCALLIIHNALFCELPICPCLLCV